MSGSITAANIQDRICHGVDALEAADYQTALVKFEAARALMAGIPRSALVKTEIEYTPDQLDATIERVRRLARQAAAGDAGIVSQPVELIRTRGECE